MSETPTFVPTAWLGIRADREHVPDGADAVHLGVVADLGAPLSRVGAAEVLAHLAATDAPRGAGRTWVDVTPAGEVRYAPLAPTCGRPTYFDGSWVEWGEPWADGDGAPVAVVVDVGGPATVAVVNAVRAEVASRLPEGARLLDYAVVTDQADHTERVTTVGAHDVWVAGRTS